MTYKVPSHRPVRHFFRRCFEIPLGALMLIVLYPIYGARELLRDLVTFWQQRPSLPRAPRATGIPIPAETPAQRAAYEKSYGKLDVATGGGVPMGRMLFDMNGDPIHRRRPVKEKLYDTEQLAGGAGIADGLGRAIEAQLGRIVEGQLGKIQKQFPSSFPSTFMGGMGDWIDFQQPKPCGTPEGASKGTPESKNGKPCGEIANVACAKCHELRCMSHLYKCMDSKYRCGGDAASGCLERALARGLPTGPLEYKDGKPREVYKTGPKICGRTDCNEPCTAGMRGHKDRRCLKHQGPGMPPCSRKGCNARCAATTVHGEPLALGMCRQHWLAHQEAEKKKVAALGMRVVSIPSNVVKDRGEFVGHPGGEMF